MPPFTPDDPRKVREILAARQQWIEKRPMIKRANLIMGPEQQKKLALAEITEAEQELGRFLTRLLEASIESADVAWFVLTYLALILENSGRSALDFDEHALQHGINGQGNASNRFDLLREYIGNMNSRSAERDAVEILRLLISIVHHIPEPLSLIDAIALAIKKNNGNRPAGMYQLPEGPSKDEGRLMNAYISTERRTRSLRGLPPTEKAGRVRELALLGDLPPDVARSFIREVAANKVQ